MSEIILRLRELAALFDSGHLSREEFDLAKKKLLDDSGPESDPPGKRQPAVIGSYQVLGLLGEGGMGRVYRARHRSQSFATQQGGDVALKILHAQHARDAQISRRFEQEATLGITLQHPGIVRVHQMVVDEAFTGMVMELVHGETLSQINHKRKSFWAWNEVRPLLSQLMDSVAYAHGQGVIHRDIKPDNIIVNSDGALKILDFGIAKSHDTNLTQTGMGMGTADYMAPEQYLDAKSVDVRADIYSIGILLYEMLVGRLPWDSTDPIERVLHLKKNMEFPGPRGINPSIPSELSDLVMRMVEAEPEDRFHDMSALRAAVAAVDHMVGQTVMMEPQSVALLPRPHTKPSSRGSLLYLALGFVALFMLGIGTMGVLALMEVGPFSRSKHTSSKEEKANDDNDDPKLEGSEEAEVREILSRKSRSEHRVFIFTDDKSQLKGLATELRGIGYKVRFSEEPNPNLNIKWGSTPRAMIDEINELAAQAIGVSTAEFDLRPEFAEDDPDVYLNILLGEPPDLIRERYGVFLFTNQEDRVLGAVQVLEEIGYSVSVLADPNQSFNIKGGDAPEWLIDEVLEIVTEETGLSSEQFDLQNSMDSTVTNIYVNLPFSETDSGGPP